METLAENKNHPNDERTLKDLSPNIAALLCYVGGWISGIIFLVLEQKNRTIRFHAIQSIIVFGILGFATAFFGSIPIVGGAFAGAVGVLAFILWVILLVKAINGEFFKMLWAGDMAEHLANVSFTQTPKSDNQRETVFVDSERRYATPPTGAEVPPSSSYEAPRQAAPVYEKPSRTFEFKARYYSLGARAGRMVGSAFAIAWSVVLLVFFNFYNQYIAYYEPIHNGPTNWQMHTLVTGAFGLCLPILTTTLVLTIVGHALLIAADKYILRQLVKTILDGFGAAAVITLLIIFPFNFSVIPSIAGSDAATFGVTVALILCAVGFVIGGIVRFIKLIVHVVDGRF